VGASTALRSSAPRVTGFLVVGLFIAFLLAGVVSYYASNSPDGLDRVATDHGIARGVQHHQGTDSPLAGYATKGVDNQRLSGGIAGVAGVAITLVIAGGLAFALRRKADGQSLDGHT
jgi:PDGLE domain